MPCSTGCAARPWRPIPPPPELEGSARAAFGLSRLDHELATLLHDSAAESSPVRARR